MARKSPYSVRDRVMMLLQTMTQKQAAQKIGVSERTIRRWKNNEKWAPTAKAPVVPTRFDDERLTRESHRERQRVQRANKRVVGTKQIVPRGVPVLPPAQRRILRVYRAGRPVPGQFRTSSWVNYDVRKLNRSSMIALLRPFAGRDYRAQFIYEAPLSSALSGYVVRDSTGKAKRVRTASAPEYLGDVVTDTDLISLIDTHFFGRGRVPLYIGIHDRVIAKKRPTKKRKGRRRGK